MKTAKELRRKFDRDMEELQESCEHKELSDWLDFMWAPGHYSHYRVKECKICGKIIYKMKTCEACQETYIVNVEEDTIFNIICDKCKEKGNYCSFHRKFYDKKCPKCEKFEKLCEEADV